VATNSTDSSGGGISVEGGGRIILNNSKISNNSAGEEGGGISVDGNSSARVVDSTVLNNRTGSDGGGIYIYAGSSVFVDGSTVSSNFAQGLGGGISSLLSSVVIHSSTISDNTAVGSGGGIFFGASDPDSILRILESTIVNNSAKDDGGGIGLVGDNAVAQFSSSIISGNNAADTADEFGKFGGTFIANDYNLFGDNSKSTAQAFEGFSPDPTGTDIIVTSDGSMPTALTSILESWLTDNGGPTMTHALVAGSPAIDAGGSGCFSTDQRGVSRSDGKCDIGSYEYSFLIFSDSFE